MFGGTELYQAYDQGFPSMQSNQSPPPPQSLDINDFSINDTDTPQLTQSATTQQQSIPNHQDHIYDPSATFKEAQLQQQLSQLQGKLKQQSIESKQNNDSMFDRFVSKKKDVLKLVTMALTVLLAISSHYVMTDLIRNYIANNDLTGNQEFTTKIAYPLTVLLLIWTLKVFNR